MIDNNEVIANVATNLIEDVTRSAWDKVKKFFVDLDAKEAIVYGHAYENYLLNTKSKNSKIKTIIYRRVPKELYAFYECIGVEYGGNIIDTNSIQNLINVSRKIIITGTGGMGKSILFKHLFLDTIENTSYIPVLIELRSFNILDTKDISLYECIYNNLGDNGFMLSKEYFEYSMKKGGYIILLDGFDELNRDKTTKITSEIKSLSDKYCENKYFISSRPTEEFIGWNDFAEMTSLSLNKQQALSLIGKLEFDKSVKDIFCKELEETLYEKYQSFASNPLLLNIMLLTFNKHASIPDKLNDFYEEAFATLFNMHDATKDSYVRDIRTELGCEDFKLVFAYICFKSYFAGEFEFSESRLRYYIQIAKDKFDKFRFSISDFQEDLTLSVCMLVKEGLNYRFSHRSFQEYFAAWYTCKIPDEYQYKLLKSWISESDSVFADLYFTMLYDLQSEKFTKIILCPGLKQVQKFYQDSGFSLKLLTHLFSGFEIKRRLIDGQKEFYDFSLKIKDKYLCNIVKLNNQLNSFDNYAEDDNDLLNAIYKTLRDKDNERVAKSNFLWKWSFEEALKHITEDDLLKVSGWFEKHIEFAISILQKYDSNAISKKKKVASIMEEL